MTNEILGKTDQILEEIKNAQKIVPAKDYILQRFLEDTETYAETVYEQTTVVCADDANDMSYFQLAPNQFQQNALSPSTSEPLFSPSTHVSTFSTTSQQYSASSGEAPTAETQVEHP